MERPVAGGPPFPSPSSSESVVFATAQAFPQDPVYVVREKKFLEKVFVNSN